MRMRASSGGLFTAFSIQSERELFTYEHGSSHDLGKALVERNQRLKSPTARYERKSQ
jgi:hypothetical protein